MIDGLAHLQRAGQVLADCGGEQEILRSSVLEAAGEFWSAVFYSDEWPAEMQRRRDELLALLLCGTIIEETVRSMDEPALHQACRQLRELAELAAGVSSQQPTG